MTIYNMVIFHSYVRLTEGIHTYTYIFIYIRIDSYRHSMIVQIMSLDQHQESNDLGRL